MSRRRSVQLVSTPECHVNTNPENKLVVMTSIFGKWELVKWLMRSWYIHMYTFSSNIIFFALHIIRCWQKSI